MSRRTLFLLVSGICGVWTQCSQTDDFSILYSGQPAFSVSQGNNTCACKGQVSSGEGVRIKNTNALSNADCTASAAGSLRSDGGRLLFCDGARFWLLSLAPTITLAGVVSPAGAAFSATNTLMTLSGPGISGAVSVTVGSQACTNITVVNAQTITVVVPVLPPASGTLPVTVMDNFGAQSSLSAAFRVYGDGSTPALAESTCQSFITFGTSRGTGLYYVNGLGATQQVYCDMTTAGGGWTRCANAATTSTTFSSAVSTTITSNFNFCNLVPGYATSAKTFAVRGVSSNIVLTNSGTNAFTGSSVTLAYDFTQYGGAGHNWWYLQAPYSTFIPTFNPWAPNRGSTSWCDSVNSFVLMMCNLPSTTNGQHGGVQASQGGCNDNAYWKDDFSWQVFTR